MNNHFTFLIGVFLFEHKAMVKYSITIDGDRTHHCTNDLVCYFKEPEYDEFWRECLQRDYGEYEIISVECICGHVDCTA